MKKYRFFLSFLCLYLAISFFSFGSLCAGRGVGDGTLIPESEEEAISWFNEIADYATSPNQYGWTFIDRAAYSYSTWLDRQAAKMGMFIPSISSNYFEYYRPALMRTWGAKLYQAQVSPLEWYNENLKINYKDNGNTEPTRADVESITASRQVMQDSFNVTNEYIIQNPLGYKEAYINSYNNLSPLLFTTYNQWKSAQEVVKQSDSPVLMHLWKNGSNQFFCDFVKLDRNRSLNYIGSVSLGGFSNVYAYYGWSVVSQNTFSASDFKRVNADGSISNLGYSEPFSGRAILNGNGSSANTNNAYVFSNQDKNELVYVFSTLNSLKAYNSGTPQPYYLSSDYSSYVPASTTFNVNSPTTNQVYNNIVDNSYSGMTPEEVQKLIESILDRLGYGNGNGSGGGSGDGSGGGSGDSLDLSFLGKIGELIAKLINGIGDLIVSVIGGIVDAFTSIIDLLTGDNGIITRLFNLIDSTFVSFLTEVFSFLPAEIITALTALIVLSVFFAILRFLRG